MTIKPQTEFEKLAKMCATPKCNEIRLIDADGTFLSDRCLHCVEQPLGLHLPSHDAKNREADAEAEMMIRINASMRRMRVSDSRTGHHSEDDIECQIRAKDQYVADCAKMEKVRSLAEKCDESQLNQQVNGEAAMQLDEALFIFDK